MPVMYPTKRKKKQPIIRLDHSISPLHMRGRHCQADLLSPGKSGQSTKIRQAPDHYIFSQQFWKRQEVTNEKKKRPKRANLEVCIFVRSLHFCGFNWNPLKWKVLPGSLVKRSFWCDLPCWSWVPILIHTILAPPLCKWGLDPTPVREGKCSDQWISCCNIHHNWYPGLTQTLYLPLLSDNTGF